MFGVGNPAPSVQDNIALFRRLFVCWGLYCFPTPESMPRRLNVLKQSTTVSSASLRAIHVRASSVLRPRVQDNIVLFRGLFVCWGLYCFPTGGGSAFGRVTLKYAVISRPLPDATDNQSQ